MNANVKFEIIVNINGVSYYLDTYGIQSMPLTYKIADVKNIEKRYASSSLTINVPETSHNRYIFNDISNLATYLTYFNPNLKTPTVVLVDSVPIFKGNLFINSVTMDLDTNETSYECNIFSENDDFFNNVGDKYLNDLDMSELNHTWSTQSIVNSWNRDYTYGYFYPLIDVTGLWNLNNINGNTSYVTYSIGGGFGTTMSVFSELKISDFYPATYVKYIWDKIFQDAGYQYTSPDEDFNSTFRNLLMPFSAKILNQPSDYVDDLQFRVATTNRIQASNTYIERGDSWYTRNLMPFDNESTPNYDPNDLWNSTDFLYRKTSTIGNKERFFLNLTFDYKWGSTVGSIKDSFELWVVRSKAPSGYSPLFSPYGVGGTVSNWNDNPTIGQLSNYPKIPFGGESKLVINSNYQNVPLTPGFNRTISASSSTFTGLNIQGYSDYLDSGNISNNNRVKGLYYDPLFEGEEVKFFLIKKASIPLNNLTVVYMRPSSYIKNQIDTTVIPNQDIDYNTVLPANLKQKDFLTSIIKMFNLYIEPDKNYPFKLLIQPRDSYYASGEVKDWSDKLDISKPIEQLILGDTQDKSTLFTYKSDSDYYNTDYSGKLKRFYGDLRYILENENLSGEKKIENIFSPTPLCLLPGSESIVLPVVFKLNNGKLQKADSFNYRILRKTEDGLINLPSEEYIRFEGKTYSYYPYIGHFDDPYAPTEDLNWGQSYLYYPNLPTNNNLFNKYWKNTMDEISDVNSKLITANFYLTSEDISNFKFSDNIYLVIDGAGSYYKVNKITNYDPTDIRMTKVELLRTLDITIPDVITTDTPRTNLLDLPNTTELQSSMTIIQTDPRGNVVTGNNNIIAGRFNSSSGYNSIISGMANSSSGYNSIISGVYNSVSSGPSKLIFGSYNSDTSSYNTLIVGNNNTSYYNNNTSIIGFGNTSSSNSSTILGSNNFIGTQSNNSFVFGDYNIVNNGLTNSVILGYGINATQAYTTYINNTTIVLGSSGSNVIISGSVSQDNIRVGLNEVAFGTGIGITSSVDFKFDPIRRSTIVGGYGNMLLDSNYSSIIGGDSNSINNSVGGYNNHIVGGNGGNITGSEFSIILNGVSNGIYGGSNIIVSGFTNSVLNSSYSSILGGNSNYMGTSSNSSMIGGLNNLIDNSEKSTIIGGESNQILNNFYSYNVSIIGGYNNKIKTGSGSIIIGGISNYIDTSYNSIGSGVSNTISQASHQSIISGSYNTLDQAENSSIIGGQNNTISGIVIGSSIVGGQNLSLTASNTVLVPTLKIDSVSLSSTPSKVLVWDDDKTIRYVDSASFSNGVSNNYNYNGLTYTGSYGYSIISGTVGFNSSTVVYFSTLPTNVGEVKNFEVTVMFDYIGFTADPNYTTTYQLYGSVMQSAFSVSSYGITSSFAGKAGAAFSTSVTASDIQFDGTAIYTTLSYPSAASPGSPPNANFTMIVNTRRNFNV